MDCCRGKQAIKNPRVISKRQEAGAVLVIILNLATVTSQAIIFFNMNLTDRFIIGSGDAGLDGNMGKRGYVR